MTIILLAYQIFTAFCSVMVCKQAFFLV